MDCVIIRETQTFGIRILLFSVIICCASFLILMDEIPILPSIFLVCITIILSGFVKSYKITKDFKNELLLTFYGVIIRRSPLDLEFPDYISVFHASFISRNEEDGTENKFKKWVVRFFNENHHFTIFEDGSYNNALEIAKELSELLEVEIYDTSKL
ncbi:hypothetical protein [Aquimarina longa]|uniref:hypothetical protein n=1 Tax=Aquimarina longa TaxID=1080221 RepID=UPI00078494B3|nr:hypothetical protein [Aquimarina longa]